MYAIINMMGSYLFLKDENIYLFILIFCRDKKKKKLVR